MKQRKWEYIPPVALPQPIVFYTNSKELGLVDVYSEGPGTLLRTTHKGRAVFESGLPLDPAMRLYERLLESSAIPLPLGCTAAVLFPCLLQHPFSICSWQAWLSRLRALAPRVSMAARSLGIETALAEAACGGRNPGQSCADCHARFAAALALSDVLDGRADLATAAAGWGAERRFSASRISAGELQRLLADTAKWLGMAALVCETAGWYPLGTLCSELAARAAAGTPRFLLPLMELPGITPARAAALHAAGLSTPEALVRARPGRVAAVLARALERQYRPRGGLSDDRTNDNSNVHRSETASAVASSRARVLADKLLRGAQLKTHHDAIPSAHAAYASLHVDHAMVPCRVLDCLSEPATLEACIETAEAASHAVLNLHWRNGRPVGLAIALLTKENGMMMGSQLQVCYVRLHPALLSRTDWRMGAASRTSFITGLGLALRNPDGKCWLVGKDGDGTMSALRSMGLDPGAELNRHSLACEASELSKPNACPFTLAARLGVRLVR